MSATNEDYEVGFTVSYL